MNSTQVANFLAQLSPDDAFDILNLRPHVKLPLIYACQSGYVPEWATHLLMLKRDSSIWFAGPHGDSLVGNTLGHSKEQVHAIELIELEDLPLQDQWAMFQIPGRDAAASTAS